MTEPTATSIIRAAFQEHHADQQHSHLVPTPQPPLRRHRRHLCLLLPPPGSEARLRLRRHARLITACSTLPAAWTIAMIALALAVRY